MTGSFGRDFVKIGLDLLGGDSWSSSSAIGRLFLRCELKVFVEGKFDVGGPYLPIGVGVVLLLVVLEDGTSLTYGLVDSVC